MLQFDDNYYSYNSPYFLSIPLTLICKNIVDQECLPSMTSIILLTIIKEGRPMNFLNFLTQSTSLLNFNLSNLTSSLSLGASQSDSVVPKEITSDKTVKEPSVAEHCTEEKSKEEEQKKEEGSQVELFTKQQQLINQYMHLNIQLLSKKLENMENIDKLAKQQEPVPQSEVKSNKKKIKKVNSCGHQDREHYAKGMCNNCYHKYGRTKKPWNCPHDKLYANGMCQNCYINTYNRKRREEKIQERPGEPDMQSSLKIEEEQE